MSGIISRLGFSFRRVNSSVAVLIQGLFVGLSVIPTWPLFVSCQTLFWRLWMAVPLARVISWVTSITVNPRYKDSICFQGCCH